MKDGGPAFPIGSGDMRDPTGMSLRDYFAAKAMHEILCGGGWGGYDRLAKESYEMADAMIEARKK